MRSDRTLGLKNPGDDEPVALPTPLGARSLGSALRPFGQGLSFEQSRFRLRAFTLALAAVAIGLFALVLALSGIPDPARHVRPVEPTARPEEPSAFPPGFVEIPLDGKLPGVTPSAEPAP